MARQTRANTAVPKDEVAIKTASKKAAAPATGDRKVRIQDDLKDKPASKKTKKEGKKPASEKDVDLSNAGVLPSLTPNGETGTDQVAPTEIINESETKHSPKHRDGKKQPSKPVIKKTKKRKAATDAATSDNEDEDADQSAVAETSLAGQSVAEDDIADDQEDNTEIDFLAGFESGSDDENAGEGDENSSDEEVEAPITKKDLPQPKQGQFAKQSSKGKAKKDVPGVVYLGRIPHGFYEEEMRSYFEQFGEVTRLRLSRNKTTGASKHYAFIEFKHSAVADIVAETMNNYLLNGHILQCRVVPTDEVHPKMWIGANRKFRPIPKGRVERLKHNAPKSDEQKEGIKTRLVKREEAKRERLRNLGIDYNFEGYSKKELPSTEEVKAIEVAKKLEKEVKKDAVVAASPAKKAKKGETSKANKKAKKA